MTILPGKYLGSELENLAGNCTYVENDGIYSSHVGLAVQQERTIAVKPAKAAHILRPGNIVLGRVAEIIEPIALVRVAEVHYGVERFVPNAFYCVLHVSRVRPGYAKFIRDEVHVGDVIKARVDSIDREEVYLSTKEQGLGVVKAYCERCRAPLVLKGEMLECNRCGSKERRRLAPEYRRLK